MGSNFASLPKNRFVILATQPDEKELFDAYINNARGYLLESSSIELIRMTLRLAEKMFLLDPALTPWLLGCINKAALPVTTYEMLTMREQEILQLLRSGFTNRKIGAELCISEATVKTHVANIFRKLDIRRRSMIIATPFMSIPLAEAYAQM